MKNLMNRRVFTALTCAISVFLSVSSCKDSEVSPKETESAISVITPEIQSKIDWLKSKRFVGKEVTYQGGTFFIDGDIMMSEQDLDAQMRKGKPGSGKNAQRQWRNLVDEEKVKDIKVAFQVGDDYVEYEDKSVEYRFEVEDEWETAFTNALEVWNQVDGSTVRFRKVDYTDNYDIKIFAVQSYTLPAVAAGDLPLASKVAGPKVKVSNGYSDLSENQKLSVAIHELGHTIGLEHTNEEHKDKYGNILDFHIQGTPSLGQDSESIMNYSINPYNSNPITTLSYYDRVAVQELYPVPVVHRASISFNLIEDYMVEFTSDVDLIGDYSYIWHFGDGHVITSHDKYPVTHKYICTTKSYNVKLIVKTSSNCIVAEGHTSVEARPVNGSIIPLSFKGGKSDGPYHKFVATGGEGCDGEKYYEWIFRFVGRRETVIHRRTQNKLLRIPFENAGDCHVTLEVRDGNSNLLSGPIRRYIFIE